MITPQNPGELAEALAQAAAARRVTGLGGAFTKDRLGGQSPEGALVISTKAMTRLLRYEPDDLTISVEAGMRWSELTLLLADNRQMVPLDPPFAAAATVGGVIAANSSGPRRRLYGTARDLVIGMQFATLEGKLVQTGGMVVKNVAGLDMGKLLIGSLGTLAALAVVNFKLTPMPAHTRTLVSTFDSLADAIAARDRILTSVLQPAAIDLLNPAASSRLGRAGHLLMIQAGGSPAVLDRYSQALPGAEPVEGEAEQTCWEKIREFTPEFLASHAAGAVVRVISTLSEMGAVMASLPCPALARAGSGICYGYFDDDSAAARWVREGPRGWNAVIEYAPHPRPPGLEQWPNPGGDFAMMEKIKRMFDPHNLLNPGRLYGRL